MRECNNGSLNERKESENDLWVYFIMRSVKASEELNAVFIACKANKITLSFISVLHICFYSPWVF